ncbi:pyridine nucleotide-disulfide oxidoreductase [Gordonia sp. zg691]|uniref:pyridine nucleotide-disulfide oxidoreductase n=1 Tax=Gordonia jinghuaiqii TaxID=2758710 RepID=UPI00166242EE|nr:pyridine nucleotide-disulfide oxidoreductase [Gordonia jinghuaiqii]MBD0863886.1 pyridine nucleotide-disulfide oxidoreductase [Gordonia jinghuaiqii]
MADPGTVKCARGVRVSAAVVGCAVLFVLAACSSGRGANNVSEPSDVAVGECVEVREADGSSTVEATRTDCDTDEMTFVATQIATGECGDYENYLTFPDTKDRLCLMPNYADGQCYQIPQSSGGSLVDFTNIECEGTPVTGAGIYRVESSGDGSIECAADQVKATYDKPEARAFCLTSLSDA